MKSRGGRLKIPGKRVPIILRVSPELATWYKVQAAKQGRSRNMLVEQTLTRFRAVVMRIDSWDLEGMPDHIATEPVATEFMRALMELGFAGRLVRDSLDYLDMQRREQLRNMNRIQKRLKSE
jgi:hypothetical protein